MSFKVLKTIFRPTKASHTPLSEEDSSSKDLGLTSLGFSVQYKGNPPRAVGVALVLTYPEKEAFPTLEGVLEEG